MNIKKYIAPAVLVVFGLVGCASHHVTPVAVSAPPPPPAVTAVPVAPVPLPVPVATPVAPAAPAAPVDPLSASGDGWSFKVVDDSWVFVDKDELVDTVLALARNSQLNARVMLVGNPFSGNQAAFTAIVSQGATESGAKVTKLVKVTINGNDFQQVSLVDGKLHVQIWTLVKNGNGYAFMCGSQTTNPKVPAACTQMANTLHID